MSVLIHHLPSPSVFDPQPTPLKCGCLCAEPNRDVRERNLAHKCCHPLHTRAGEQTSVNVQQPNVEPLH